MERDLRYESFGALREKLASAVLDVERTGSEAERTWLAAMWVQLLDALTPKMRLPEEGLKQQALRFLCEILYRQRLFDVQRERPDWLDEALLTSLLDEALARRRTDAAHSERAVFVRSGTIAQSLAQRPAFRKWVAERLGFETAEKAYTSYVFYEHAGHYAPLHIDKPDSYAINCLIKLAHAGGDDGQRSLLVALDGSGTPSAFDLAPGEVVLFSSAATPHGRTPLSADEAVVLLLIGMRPMEQAAVSQDIQFENAALG